jgi:hypothetical protein
MMVTRKIVSQNDTFSNLDWYTLIFISKMDFIRTIDSVFFSNWVYHKNPKRGTNE